MLINNDFGTPFPVLFNCIKHHSGYVSEFIRSIDITCPDDLQLLKGAFNIIGSSQMDLYTGKLMPMQIAGEITSWLKTKELLNKSVYLSWLNTAKLKYREIKLSDGSVWVLLPGKTAGRHVHIHPGRYSRFTVRVRSETLKTAIAVLCFCNCHGKDHTNLKVINEARTELLDLSPVKEVSLQRGLGKMIGILSEILRKKGLTRS